MTKSRSQTRMAMRALRRERSGHKAASGLLERINAASTPIVALGTLALAVATFWLASDTHRLAADSEHNTKILTYGQRAWVAPLAALAPKKWDVPPNENAEVALIYKNVGKEPATKVSVVHRATAIERGDFRNNARMRAIISNLFNGRACRTFGVDADGPTVFPVEGAQQSAIIGFNSATAKLATSENHFPLIVGCIIYETIESVRYTDFCRIFEPVGSPPRQAWRSDECFVHNDAD